MLLCTFYHTLQIFEKSNIDKPRIKGFNRVLACVLAWCCEDVGCPPGKLYRECERGEGCPFSCAQVSGREGCYSDSCEEGCHCPPHTYQHLGACIEVGSEQLESWQLKTKQWLQKLILCAVCVFQECPCLVDKEFLASLQSVSVTPVSSLLSNISEGMEFISGDTLTHDCSTWWAEFFGFFWDKKKEN